MRQRLTTMDNVMAPQAITRSADHRYTYEGVTYPGVTSILKVLDKSDALMGWAARQTAEAAIALMEQPAIASPEGGATRALYALYDAVGAEGVIRALTARSSWQRDEAASLGTEVHAAADYYMRHGSMEETPGPLRDRIKLYADWWQASGWTLRLSEAMIVNPEWGYGGTFDLLALDPEGRTVLADIKTGKGVYREAVLQLTAYGAYTGTVVQFTDGKVYPMPHVDRFVVLHVTTDGVREVELTVGNREMSAFLACLDLHHWAESMKGKRL